MINEGNMLPLKKTKKILQIPMTDAKEMEISELFDKEWTIVLLTL